ncbi:hypothetical protein Pfo_022740, partial [Paulownia fortunei]
MRKFLSVLFSFRSLDLYPFTTLQFGVGSNLLEFIAGDYQRWKLAKAWNFFMLK